MARIKDLIIDLEQQGKISYDDERRRYYINRAGRATRRCEEKNASRVSAEEHSKNDAIDEGWRELFLKAEDQEKKMFTLRSMVYRHYEKHGKGFKYSLNKEIKEGSAGIRVYKYRAEDGDLHKQS